MKAFKSRSRGLSMIELLVALAIGSVIIAGAVFVYSQSRKTHTVADNVARLQENARYVISILEPDIQLAGYYGFSNEPNDVHFMSAGSSGGSISAFDMQQGKPAVETSGNECGDNFAVDVLATVDGSNNTWGLDCDGLGGGAIEGPDRLTVRRGSNDPPAGETGKGVSGRLQLLVSRLSPSNAYLFSDGALPDTPELKADFVQVRDMLVHTYYISKDSTSPDVPDLHALRMKSLTDGPAFADDGDVEIMRGVEDMQVQFGVDTADYDGKDGIDKGRDEDGNGIPDVALGIATRYVNPDQLPAGFQVVSVRIWLLVRAEAGEPGYVNQQTYKYADREYAVNDNVRRLLVSRTIQLRNARTL